jgi:hypothetical protein
MCTEYFKLSLLPFIFLKGKVSSKMANYYAKLVSKVHFSNKSMAKIGNKLCAPFKQAFFE